MACVREREREIERERERERERSTFAYVVAVMPRYAILSMIHHDNFALERSEHDLIRNRRMVFELAWAKFRT